MKLSSRELFFLDTLHSMKHNHCTQDFLQAQLKTKGMDTEEFNKVKKKLLYSGYIGIVYGNITLEKNDYYKEI